MMRTSRHDLGACIIVREDVWLLYGSNIESESVFSFHTESESVFSLYFISVIFSIFSTTSVVRKESSVCKPIYRHESNKIVTMM